MKGTIAVLGGTGFIGTHVVRRLREVGYKVSVMARKVTDLPALFQDEGIRVMSGDIRNIADVRQAIAGTTHVINLAYGGGKSWAEIRDAIVGGAEQVARACIENGIPLIHISSIAALYLGTQPSPLTGATPVDLRADRRPYARAKALSEERLLQLRRDSGLRVCILRPGLVVGVGTSPFHSALGSCSDKRGCVGWNEGYNPLPFVLVDDVADAIMLVCTSSTFDGSIYNLVGDVRPSAREYLAELARVLNRPLHFQAANPHGLYLKKMCKWCIKRLIGMQAARPSLRDTLSRGLKAEFDCSDIKNDLGWKPVSDRTTFYRKAFELTVER